MEDTMMDAEMMVTMSPYYIVNASNASANSSSDGDEAGNDAAMPDVLALRFIPFTILAAVCFILNLLSLLAMLETRQSQRKVRHVLLINLAVCDLVGSVLLWMYQNAYQIFPRFVAEKPIHCLFIFSVLVAPFVLSLCISAFSLLLLALNQLAAICWPLFATSRLAPRHAILATATAWGVATAAAMCPGVVLVVFWPIEQCTLYRHKIGKLSIELCAYSLLALILAIVIVYANIYRVVLKHRHYEPEVGRRNMAHEHKGNYKAFVTILLLTGSLSLFWLPYMLFHFISAHVLDTDNELAITDALIYVKVYIIDFLPMLNFLADPIIYGLRMPEVRLGYRRLAREFLCGYYGTAGVSSVNRINSEATTATITRRYQLQASKAGCNSVRVSSVYVCGGSPHESQTMLMMTHVNGNGGRKISQGLYSE